MNTWTVLAYLSTSSPHYIRDAPVRSCKIAKAFDTVEAAKLHYVGASFPAVSAESLAFPHAAWRVRQSPVRWTSKIHLFSNAWIEMRSQGTASFQPLGSLDFSIQHSHPNQQPSAQLQSVFLCADMLI